MRITIEDLKIQVSGTNRTLGINDPDWTTEGSYMLNCCEDRYAIYKLLSGGVAENIFGGHIPAKELYFQIVAYNRGILEGKYLK